MNHETDASKCLLNTTYIVIFVASLNNKLHNIVLLVSKEFNLIQFFHLISIISQSEKTLIIYKE